MTRTPDRKPSTLAANRALAAARPMPIPAAKAPADGKLSVQQIARDLASKPVASRTKGRPDPGTATTWAAPLHPAKGAPIAAVTAAALKKGRAKAMVKDDGEQRIVFTIAVCFLACISTLAAVRIGDNMEVTKAKAGIETTFKEVHQQQQNFRALKSRFATWNELAATGATLPTSQGVAGSNADASHWYLSLRDQNTGVVCDRTGELFDESADERKPVCRDK